MVTFADQSVCISYKSLLRVEMDIYGRQRRRVEGRCWLESGES